MQQLRASLRSLWKEYPELAGDFAGQGRLTKSGFPSLVQSMEALTALLAYQASRAEELRTSRAKELRTKVPADVQDQIGLSTTIPIRFQQQASTPEKLAILEKVRAMAFDKGYRATGFRVRFNEGQRAIYYDLPALRARVNDDEEKYKAEGPADITYAELVISDAPRPGISKPRAARHGAFFHYTLSCPDMDLTRYGVYQTFCADNYGADSCLLETFKALGMRREMLSAVRCFVRVRDFAATKLAALADHVGIHITLHVADSAVQHEGPGHRIPRVVAKKYGDPNSSQCYEIGLIENHYFPFDSVTPYGPLFLSSIDEILAIVRESGRPISEFYQVTERRVYASKAGEKVGFITAKSRIKQGVSSYALLRGLLKAKTALVPISAADIVTIPFGDMYADAFERRDYELVPAFVSIRGEDGKIEYKGNAQPIIFRDRFQQEEKIGRVVYADFETSTMETPAKPAIRHVPYMVGWLAGDRVGDVDPGSKPSVSFGSDPAAIIEEFLDAAVAGLEGTEHVALVYFHNLRYDWACLVDHVCVESVCEKEGSLYEVKFRHRGCRVTLRDSYKLIPLPLSEFPKCFGLHGEKEAYPYDWYTRERVRKKLRSSSVASVVALMEKTQPERLGAFKESLAALGMERRFGGRRYAKYYCGRDVELLAQGLIAFRDQILEATELSIHAYRTISSLSFEYQVMRGCFDGVYMLSGIPNRFISASVAGGQVHIAHGRPCVVDEPCCDFDMTSCYPSAQALGPGYPRGLPRIIEAIDDFNLENTPMPYFVEIELLDAHYSGGHDFAFPPLCEKVDGRSVYTDKPTQRRHVMSSIQLRDATRHYGWKRGVDYRALRGYWFPDGWNRTICSCIVGLFEARKRLKAAGNPLQFVYKLMLNSSYGKTITKPPTTKLSIVSHVGDEWETRRDRFIKNHIGVLSHAYEGERHTFFRCFTSIGDHWSCPQAGSYVLSQAKWLMHGMFLKAREVGARIYYTDTDSVIINRADLGLLKEFEGSGLGQFHTDLESGPLEKAGVRKRDIYAKRSVFVGKKTYHLTLAGLDEEGRLHTDEVTHARMKGVPKSALIERAKSAGCSIAGFYDELVEGRQLEVDMLAGGLPSFRYGRDMSVRSLEAFTRTIKPPIVKAD